MRRISRLGAMGLIVLAGQAFADGGAAHQVKQVPPVKMGTSGGQISDASRLYCCGGTLGALVMRDGVLCILSNNHVLAVSGAAPNGDDTLQPGLIDSNCGSANSNRVGDFAGNLVPLGTANVDTALSVARAGMVDTSGAILDIGVPCTTVRAPSVGLAVAKSGRTTGFTTGSITSVNTSVQIQYQKGCNSGKKFSVIFTNQIVTGPMSAGGDSGSLLVTNDSSHKPVGLLFAGSSSVTIYNPIQAVINAYTSGGHTFSFVGNSCAALARAEQPGMVGDAAVATVLQTKVEHEHELMRTPGVWGVGIGADAADPTKAAIVIYMERPDHGKGADAIPNQIDGVNVIVIPTDPIVAQ